MPLSTSAPPGIAFSTHQLPDERRCALNSHQSREVIVPFVVIGLRRPLLAHGTEFVAWAMKIVDRGRAGPGDSYWPAPPQPADQLTWFCPLPSGCRRQLASGVRARGW